MKRLFSHITAGEVMAFSIVVLVIGTAVYWQRNTDSQQRALDEQTEVTYVSPAGEFEFTLPTDWRANPDSVEEDGLVRFELYGPRNNVVNKAYADAIGDADATIERDFLNAQYSNLFESSVGKEFALLQIEVVSSRVYEIAPNREAWLEQVEGTPSVAEGIAIGPYEEISVPGGEGYVYPVKIFEQGREIVSTNYYLLGDLAEAEILFYPADSAFREDVQEIIDSFKFTTNEEIDEFLNQEIEARTNDSDERTE